MIVIVLTLLKLIAMLKHVYRRTVVDSGVSFLHQIEYAFTEEGLVDIQYVRLHMIDVHGVVQPSLLSFKTLPHAARLVALNTLIEDGVIEFP